MQMSDDWVVLVCANIVRWKRNKKKFEAYKKDSVRQVLFDHRKSIMAGLLWVIEIIENYLSGKELMGIEEDLW